MNEKLQKIIEKERAKETGEPPTPKNDPASDPIPPSGPEETIAALKVAQEKLELYDSLLREFVTHVATRDGMGQISKTFCKGCSGGVRTPCPLTKAREALGL